jgi:2,4-dienoyl-CoA reductase (NADPH2)
VQVGLHDTPLPIIQSQAPEGKWVYMAEAIKKVVNIPVITGWQIGDPVMADKILAEGRADLVGMARPFIADPEIGLKAKEGRFDEIRYCTRCCRCVDQAVGRTSPVEICTVNPRMGADLDSDIEPAAKPKKVLVVGGGPAGMEAARVAAMRGHEVSLYEKNPKLGGLMLFGCIVTPHIEKPVNYLTGAIKKLGVKVELGKEVTPALVAELKPDVVIVAPGGLPPKLDIPGIDGENVISSHDMAELFGGNPPKKLGGKLGAFALKHLYKPSRLRSLMGLNFPFGKKVAILGGGFAGVELGDALAEKGKEVSIIEEFKQMGYDVGPSTRFVYMMRLREFKANMIPNAKVSEVTSQSVKGTAVSKEGASQPFEIETNTVAIARGLEANKVLAQQLEGKGPAVFLIGDAAERKEAPSPAIWGKMEPRRIGEAIKAAYRVALKL